MDKLHLIFDRVHKINENVIILEQDEHIKLLLKGVLIDDTYKVIYELFDGHFIAMKEDNSRVIIDSAGNRTVYWDYKDTKCSYLKELKVVGKYIDSLDDTYKQHLIKKDKQLYINKYHHINKINIDISKSNTADITKITLIDSVNSNTIDSIIRNGVTTIGFTSNNQVKKINILSNDIMHIDSFGLDGNYIHSGLYNREKLLFYTDKYYRVTVNIAIIQVKGSKDFKLIVKGEITDNSYSFVGCQDNMLYLQDSSTGEHSILDCMTLQYLTDIEVKDIDSCLKEYTYMVHNYKINKRVRGISI